jgi:hypothetical protein
MSVNYAVSIPTDQGQHALQEYPSPIKAKARYSRDVGTASSVITLTEDTTVIEVSGADQGAVLRWVPRTETTTAPFASVINANGSTANFDHIIPGTTYRRFVVPIEVQGNPQSIQGANRLNGLYQRVAIKSLGTSSVIAIEY